MERKKYIYWEDDGMWLGYFEEYPDYMTQGETLEELKDNLRDVISHRPTQTCADNFHE